MTTYRYNCRDYPGMEGCPGSFTAGTKEEAVKHAELHGREAHGEDPEEYSDEERATLWELTKPIE